MYAEENHLPWRNLRDRDIGPIYLVYHLLGMILKQPHHICYRNNPFSSMSRGSGTLNIQLRRVLDLKQVVLCSVDTQHMISWKNPLVALQSLSLLFQFPHQHWALCCLYRWDRWILWANQPHSYIIHTSADCSVPQLFIFKQRSEIAYQAKRREKLSLLEINPPPDPQTGDLRESILIENVNLLPSAFPAVTIWSAVRTWRRKCPRKKETMKEE